MAAQTCRRLQNRDGSSAMVLDAMCQSHFFSKNWLQSLAGDVRKIKTECLSEVFDHVCSSDIQVLPDSTAVSAALANGAP